MAKRYYIWCPGTIKKMDDGKLVSTTIGPNQDINLCLHRQCECDALWDRILENEYGTDKQV